MSGMVIFHLGAKIRQNSQALSNTMNLGPSVEFHYPTLVITNDSNNICTYIYPKINSRFIGLICRVTGVNPNMNHAIRSLLLRNVDEWE